jgi:V/A-type H+-transporting ATPase subunit A
MKLLHQENELEQIVRLVGIDTLSPQDRLIMETARMIREDFLQQNAFLDTDSYTSPQKQYALLELILEYSAACSEAIEKGARPDDLFVIPSRERIGRAKYSPENEFEQKYKEISVEMKAEIKEIADRAGDM